MTEGQPRELRIVRSFSTLAWCMQYPRPADSVIPAQAGIHDRAPVARATVWIPAFAGMTGPFGLSKHYGN